MKAKIILSLLILAISIELKADYRSDVSTPKGSLVEAWIMDESSLSVRQANDTYYSGAYPNAQKMITFNSLSSTRRFNCHGYAWYMSELATPLNSPKWIGYSTTTAEDIYMTDGSYVQTSTAQFPGKVSYTSDDHSAVTTNQTGWYISKWGPTLWCKHLWNDTPYNEATLKYYIKAGVPYTLYPSPCNGIFTNVTMPGNPGDVVVLKLSFGGYINWNGQSNGSGAQISLTCAGATNSAATPHYYSATGFSLSTQITFTMPSSSTTINTTVVVHNSQYMLSSTATLEVLTVNGAAVNKQGVVCGGNSGGSW
jgi:hypothetical protein